MKSAGPVMDDRKRSVPHDASDDAPPFKRQAIQSSSAPQNNHQVPQSQEDVVHFQKEAIWRQMQEYKREKSILEQRIQTLDKRCAYHDNHLLIVDAWWDQVLDEVSLLVQPTDGAAKPYQNGVGSENVPSSLTFDDVTLFSEHLKEKKEHILSSLSILFKAFRSETNLKQDSERVEQLHSQMRSLMVNDKANKVEIARLEKELESVQARLTDTTIKYLTAEKKVDRLKSQTLAKIERQAMFNAGAGPEAKKEGGSEDQSAKDREINAKIAEGNFADAEQARKEAQAIVSKQREELEKLQADNSRLSGELTKLTIKFGRLTEDDISSCDAFKNLKVKLDDLAARFNHIEALNRELAEKADKFEVERHAFQEKTLLEQQEVISDVQAQLTKAEQDLARVRAGRDELLEDQKFRKTREDQKIASVKEISDLAETRAARIETLEMEVERLRTKLAEEPLSNNPESADLNLEDLRQKHGQLEKSYRVLAQELPGLEQAFKKAHEQSTKKVAHLQEMEEKMKRLQLEKNKADSKYFSAMKAKQLLQDENRNLKTQNSRSTEIITQLKEAEKRVKDLMSNLEKQLVEMRSMKETLHQKNREQQARATEQSNTIEALNRQVDSLSNALKSRDAALAKETSARRERDEEIQALQERVKKSREDKDSTKTKTGDNSQLEALRQIALCAVCRNRFKNTAIRSCGHVFCKQCADERIASRSRKCPNCGRGFAATDLIAVHL